MIIADVIPTEKYPSQLLLFTEGNTTPYQSIAGPRPNLRVPGGVALDTSNRIYVTNLQGRSVAQYILPTPTPTPSGSPSPTPSPTPTPTGSPTASPTPSPTPTPVNIRAIFTLFGKNTGIVTPAGVDVDSSGNIYVADQGQLGHLHSAAILIFAQPKVRGDGNILNVKPSRTIQGNLTGLTTPTDVKVNSNAGLIYVADSKSILIFPINASGNTKPSLTYTSPGALTGLGVIPVAPSPTASP